MTYQKQDKKPLTVEILSCSTSILMFLDDCPFTLKYSLLDLRFNALKSPIFQRSKPFNPLSKSNNKAWFDKLFLSNDITF